MLILHDHINFLKEGLAKVRDGIYKTYYESSKDNLPLAINSIESYKMDELTDVTIITFTSSGKVYLNEQTGLVYRKLENGTLSRELGEVESGYLKYKIGMHIIESYDSVESNANRYTRLVLGT